MRIVLDTNIIIAAFLSHGLTSDVLELGEQEDIEVFSSEEIYVENFINLTRKSLKLVNPIQKIDVVKSDPDDNKILECAVSAEANLIVTMDKHLLKFMTYEKIGIV